MLTIKLMRNNLIRILILPIIVGVFFIIKSISPYIVSYMVEHNMNRYIQSCVKANYTNELLDYINDFNPNKFDVSGINFSDSGTIIFTVSHNDDYFENGISIPSTLIMSPTGLSGFMQSLIIKDMAIDYIAIISFILFCTRKIWRDKKIFYWIVCYLGALFAIILSLILTMLIYLVNWNIGNNFINILSFIILIISLKDLLPQKVVT